MKQSEENRNLESLFRGQFENYEMKPSGDFWPRFGKKLRSREFLRFNPGRFNIVYLSSVITAGVIATVLLTGGSKKLDESTAAISGDKMITTDVIERPVNPPASSGVVKILDKQDDKERSDIPGS